MIDEDDLRRLLSDAAESVPPPGRAPDSLLAELGERAVVPRVRWSSGRKLGAVAAAVLAVIAFGATLSTDMSSDDDATFSETGGAITGGGDEDAADGSLDAAPADGDLEPDDGTKRRIDTVTAEPPAALEGSGSSGVVAGGAAAAPGQPSPPVDSAKVIKTGSLDLEVREGAFGGTVDRITAQVIGLGGHIAESTTSESSETPSGSIVARVPAGSFESLLADLRRFGEVRAVSSKGTDVTAQFTDLAARLAALSATRDRLSAVLSEAANVPDILAVQDRITGVQVEIEQIQGQQRLLEDQTAFATLAITLGEPGAELIEVESEPNEGLGQAWDDARRRFGDSVENLVSWSGSAAVVVIVGLILLGLSRLAWVRVRRRMV